MRWSGSEATLIEILYASLKYPQSIITGKREVDMKLQYRRLNMSPNIYLNQALSVLIKLESYHRIRLLLNAFN